MKKIIVYAVILLSTTNLQSCVPAPNPDKQIQDKFLACMTEEGKMTYGNYFTQLAGIRGEVKYQVLTEQGETDPAIKIMQVDIDKKYSTVTYKTAKFQYQFNTNTGFVKLRYLAINGEGQNILTGAMTLDLMLLESAYK